MELNKVNNTECITNILRQSKIVPIKNDLIKVGKLSTGNALRIELTTLLSKEYILILAIHKCKFKLLRQVNYFMMSCNGSLHAVSVEAMLFIVRINVYHH